MPNYDLTQEDIQSLTGPSLWRDWMDSNDPRDINEYKADWLKRQSLETQARYAE